MKLPENERATARILLKECRSYPNGEPLLTRLFLNDGGREAAFWVESCYLGGAALVRVGADPETAIRFFSLVSLGEVTPVTLGEVWEDFCYTRKNVKKSLYICEKP